MNIREKVRKQLDRLTDEELQVVSQMIHQLKSSTSAEAPSSKKRLLKPRRFGGKLDGVNLRDIALIGYWLILMCWYTLKMKSLTFTAKQLIL
ncbi:hypothetical protein [Tunicatimonas pelagia]|uniref:hypothetical protein n=1 Tax=Tunicatimonas pelagia TaxID=931531 RepID=UPI002665AE07|nr:hypothetical protein [Tunicatimonas pelagia]WKN45534.1 hypothetical protein P0M28_11255 [Tunicatimonas pelagia]